MFNVGLGELLFIAILALIFIGPERLPQVLRQLGEAVYKLRVMLAEITNEFADEMRPIQEMRSLADDLNPSRQLGRALDPRPRSQDSEKAQGLHPEQGARPQAAGSNPMAQLSQAMAAQGLRPEQDAPPEQSIAPPHLRSADPASTQRSGPMAQLSQAVKAGDLPPPAEPADEHADDPA